MFYRTAHDVVSLSCLLLSKTTEDDESSQKTLAESTFSIRKRAGLSVLEDHSFIALIERKRIKITSSAI